MISLLVERNLIIERELITEVQHQQRSTLSAAEYQHFCLRVCM